MSSAIKPRSRFCRYHPPMPLSFAHCGWKAVSLTTEQIAYIESIQPLGVPMNVLTTITEYYIVNKPYDSDWCVLLISNIEAYLGSSALNKQNMSKIPTEFIQKKKTATAFLFVEYTYYAIEIFKNVIFY